MKLLHYSLVSVCAFMLNIANANVMSAHLNQNSKKVDVVLKVGDMLSIKYDLRRTPIFRSSEWWSYALRCVTSDSSTFEYNLKEETKSVYLPALFSNYDDQQAVGLNIDEQGVVKIKNVSNEDTYITCELYNKFGN
jgi:hypothetical protein